MSVFGVAEVVAGLNRAGADGLEVRGYHLDGVEEAVGDDAVAALDEFGGEVAGEAVDLHRNLAETFRTVPYCIHTGHNGHQGSGGADVGGGFVAFDVLFAGLEGEAVAFVAETVH